MWVFRLWDVNKRGPATSHWRLPKASRESSATGVNSTLLRASYSVAYAPGSPTVVKAEPAPDWDAKFQGKSFWIGGDGDGFGGPGRWANSLALGRHPSRRRQRRRSTGREDGQQHRLESRTTRDAAIRFLAGKKANGKPASFILPDAGKGWFWPLVGARACGERLFIFLAHIDKAPNPGVFGFKGIGVTLAVVDNPDAEPEKWHMKQHDVPFGDFTKGRERSWGSSLLPVGKEIYIYGYAEERGKGPLKRHLIVAQCAGRKAG